MKYSNIKVFDLYCPSEMIKEITILKLESGVDTKFEVLGSNLKRRTIINYNDTLFQKLFLLNFRICNILKKLVSYSVKMNIDNDN